MNTDRTTFNEPRPVNKDATHRALVVDDNAVNRKLAMAMLGRLGWQVDEADNGVLCLERVHTTQYDLLLLDISMPGISGTEVCKEIRRDQQLNTLYVVAYTAHAHEDERAAIVASGFDDLLIKPISLKALQDILARI